MLQQIIYLIQYGAYGDVGAAILSPFGGEMDAGIAQTLLIVLFL